MYSLLSNLRIVEGASFIAAPSCGLHLGQLGAEVIRFDHIGGGLDHGRWPRTSEGASLYWEGLNKGKKSVAIDLRSPEGRELAVRIATAPGPGAGLFVTNFPVNGWLSHENLKAHRDDVISVRVMGWADGATALDYTVNAALGYPLMTGPPELGDEPVNHVLPAWDLLAGCHAAMAMMAAEQQRRVTGEGREVRIPLGDVGLATLGHLGQVAEVLETGEERPRYGNELYGAFGRDYRTRDGERLMIVAITRRQWVGLLRSLALEDKVASIEREVGIDLGDDEALRFQYRDRLHPLIEDAVAGRDLSDLETAFSGNGVCYERYRTVREAVDEKCRGSDLYQDVTHPSGRTYPTPGATASFVGLDRETPGRAPRLGEHTDEVLADVLGMADHEIGGLHDRKLVATG